MNIPPVDLTHIFHVDHPYGIFILFFLSPTLIPEAFVADYPLSTDSRPIIPLLLVLALSMPQFFP